ncbi:MAG: hypothetical protein GX825_04500 [Syntrophomonadaceae bacterium]|nr:hypothetical protein [Syntrophomonadaceae bacterium]
MVAVIIPLLGTSIQRASDLALSMESRGYTGNCSSPYRTGRLGFSGRDLLASLLVIALLLGSFLTAP